MSHVLYRVTSNDVLFNGNNNIVNRHKDLNYWYEGDDRKKSLDLVRKYSDDVIEIYKNGISRDVYRWSAVELDDCDELVGYELKIFDPLDRFKLTKKIAKYAHLFSGNGYDLISYIVGTRELIGNGVCKYNDHWIDLYRYKDSAFGDFTAYEDNGHLWLPEDFKDYGIMNPDELTLAMNEGVMFWTDYQIDDPELKLMYRTFQNRSL